MASIVLLAVLIVLAWFWLLSGAGTGMKPSAFFWPEPPVQPPIMPGMTMEPAISSWSAGRLLLMLSMWWIMMAAMMLPSAAPTILLFARVAARGPAEAPRPATGMFLAGYLLVWGLFALAATILQWLLSRIDMMAPMHMASADAGLSAAILFLAGLYQLTPLKDACLRQCRDPARFLSRHYRPGRAGAMRMGVLHGVYCVGCCWMLMALLFVGGIMNLIWIALLTVLVALEKLVPRGRLIALGSGLALIIWAAAILLY